MAWEALSKPSICSPVEQIPTSLVNVGMKNLQEINLLIDVFYNLQDPLKWVQENPKELPQVWCGLELQVEEQDPHVTVRHKEV